MRRPAPVLPRPLPSRPAPAPWRFVAGWVRLSPLCAAVWLVAAAPGPGYGADKIIDDDVGGPQKIFDYNTLTITKTGTITTTADDKDGVQTFREGTTVDLRPKNSLVC